MTNEEADSLIKHVDHILKVISYRAGVYVQAKYRGNGSVASEYRKRIEKDFEIISTFLDELDNL